MSDPQSRFDLGVLEFDTVREALTEKLSTGLGRREVEELAPLGDADVLARLRAQVVALAGRLETGNAPPLGSGLLEIRPWLARFFAGQHQPTNVELGELLTALKACHRTRSWLGGGSGSDTPLAAAGDAMPDVRDLAEEFERIVDTRGEVQASASVRLAELRNEVVRAEGGVRTAIQRFLDRSEARKSLQNPEPVWRHGRPVFAVRVEARGRIRGVTHDRSQSGATVFIEPEEVIEATNRLSDAQAAVHREEQVVIAHLCKGLRRNRQTLEAAVDAVAAFDLDLARARLVHEEGFLAAPVERVSEARPAVVRLRRALHPLLLRAHRAAERGVSRPRVVETLGLEPPAELVPLDLTLGEPFRQLVVTGPNTGGKTVALKTVGLLTVMACAGVPVPAEEGTSFPLLDGVFVDIGDAQGISQNLSTFSSHVQRIARCLKGSGPRSLVLLDELGAGTDPEEGGALGYAVLEELGRESGGLAVVTTHLGRLKEFAYRHPHTENGAMAFDGESLAPLYRLEVGIPGTSHALDIAGRVGMPASVVERARALLEGQRDQRLDEVIQQVQVVRQEAEEQRRRTERLSREAEKAERELAEQQQQVTRQKAWLHEEADDVLDAAIRRLRSACEPALADLENGPQKVRVQATALREALDAAVRETSIGRRRRQFAASIKKDSVVYLPKFGKRVTVRKVDRARETVTVEVGRMRVEVGFEEVSWIQPLDAG